MSTDTFQSIIGKTVRGVVEKEETSDSTGGLGTETQFHILFEDGTSLVIWAYRPHVEYNTQQDGLEYARSLLPRTYPIRRAVYREADGQIVLIDPL